MMTRTPLFCAFAILLMFGGSDLRALQIHDYQKIRHLRFEEGTYLVAPVPNSTLWASDLVFNGVGWSSNDPVKSFALVSPRHFVGANHFRPSVGSQIHFLSTDGKLRSYTYEGFYNLKNANGENTDIFIGRLSEDIPASHNIPFYPVLDEAEIDLVGREILVYGRGQSGPRIGRGVIAAFNDSFGGGVLGSPLSDTRNYTFEYTRVTARQMIRMEKLVTPEARLFFQSMAC